jgi:dihydroxy-acid dehydratase
LNDGQEVIHEIQKALKAQETFKFYWKPAEEGCVKISGNGEYFEGDYCL